MAWANSAEALGRTQRPADRENERNEKDREKRALERSNAQDLNELESYIEHITGLHHALIDPIDWASVAARRPDQPPFNGNVQAWQQEQQMCQKVMAKDDGMMLAILKKEQTLTQIHKLGRGLGFSVFGGVVHAVLTLHDQGIVPDFQFKYMPSGKLTETKMPRDKMLKLYRSYVNSASLKVASDILRLIPADEVVVSSIGHNPALDADYEEDWPILSVQYRRSDFMRLDLPNTDPVLAHQIFTLKEAFEPLQGHGPITPLMEIPHSMALQ